MSLDAANDPADPPSSDDSLAGDEAAWASERAAIRELIAAALDKAGPQPIARRTLALLLEARIEPSAEPPGYRVVDRAGAPRRHPETGEPLTLDDLVAELRRDKPSLFKPAEPEPVIPSEPADAVPAAEPAPRPWAKPSARMRSLVAASRRRGKALASAGAAWVRARGPGRASVGAASPPWRKRVRRAGLRLRYGAAILSARSLDRLRRGLDDARDAVGAGGLLRRPSMIAALLGIGILGLLTLISGNDRPSEPPAPDPRAAVPVQQNAQEQPAPPSPEAEPPARAKATPPQPPSDEEPAPDDAPMQADVAPEANGISGKAEVIDTATLKIAGKVVRLFGVVWVRGGQSEELARYLGGRPVTCRPVAGSDAHLCSVEGRDLSEVVLFNGGGRASPEATPDLVAAEDRARTERLGVWAR